MNIAASFERAIKEHKPATSQQPFSDAPFVIPHYEGYSIANLGATIARLLERDPEGMAPSLPSEAWSHLSGDVRNIIVLVSALALLDWRSGVSLCPLHPCSRPLP